MTDAIGNRASQTDSTGTNTYNYPTGSNQLASIVNGSTTERCLATTPPETSIPT